LSFVSKKQALLVNKKNTNVRHTNLHEKNGNIEKDGNMQKNGNMEKENANVSYQYCDLDQENDNLHKNYGLDPEFLDIEVLKKFFLGKLLYDQKKSRWYKYTGKYKKQVKQIIVITEILEYLKMNRFTL
jgi:hypothetical protein